MGQGHLINPPLPSTPPSAAIVLHGLGSPGDEWAIISLTLSFFSLNSLAFLIPSAPQVPVTYQDNAVLHSWFDITRLTSTSAAVDRPSLLASVNRVREIIDWQVSLGVPTENIFVIGFSQGGAVALTLAMRETRKLGGVIGVATWLPRETDYQGLGGTEQVNGAGGADVLMMHGQNDEVLSVAFARRSARNLRNVGIKTNFTVIPDGGHVLVERQVVDAIEQFIIDRSNGTTNYLQTTVDDLTNAFGDGVDRLL